MATVYGSLGVNFRDQRGFTTRRVYTLAADTEADLLLGAQNMITNLQAISNATIASTSGLVLGSNPAFGLAAEYADVAQQLNVEAHSVDGTRMRWAIPCPKANCFLADKITLDQATNTGIAAFIAAVNAGNIVQKDTFLGAQVDGGFFQWRSKKRRISIGVKNPALSGPA